MPPRLEVLTMPEMLRRLTGARDMATPTLILDSRLHIVRAHNTSLASSEKNKLLDAAYLSGIEYEEKCLRRQDISHS